MSVTFLHAKGAGVPEANLEKIVAFMGAHVRKMRAVRGGLGLDHSDALVASAQAFEELCGGDAAGKPWEQIASKLPSKVFLYGFQASHSSLLQRLCPELRGIETVPANGATVSFTADCPAICRQLSGVTFASKRNGVQSVFNLDGKSRGCRSLIAASGKPFVVSLDLHGTEVILQAGDYFANLDEIVPQDSIVDYLPGLAPLMTFLRYACPQAVWHNDTPSACFIVDDPPLKKRYGFFDFEKLFALMRNKSFSLSIAFIPWNFKRSEPALAREFAAQPKRYSLCVHGCDHTWGEFDSSDEQALRDRAQQALDRMAEHRKLSGVDFDDVMIFPQGLFSTTAMKAVKSCGYLAAINSRPHPMDAEFQLPLRDFLEVAVGRFHDFPLFFRRYPAEQADLAFDLFLGRPAFLVEHHGFFRDGLKALAATIDKVNQLAPNISWTNLSSACSRACVRKVNEKGETEVKFFTDRFSLENDSKSAQRYVLVRPLRSSATVKAVSVNGRRTRVHRDETGLRIELSLAAGEHARVSLEFARDVVPVKRRQQRIHQAKVFLRRSLSELRVNYLERTPFLTASTGK